MIKRILYIILITTILYVSESLNQESVQPSNNLPSYDFLHDRTKLSFDEINQARDWIDTSEREYLPDWQEYYSVLPKLINGYNLQVGCEIGVAFGTHSATILEKTQVSKLYSIDPYTVGFPYCDHPKAEQFSDILFYKVKALLSLFGARSILVRMTSIKAAKLFSPGLLDFVFIDALHDYESVREDIEAWYPIVRRGGIIAGDDYTQQFPGVIKAVTEFFSAKKIKVNQDPDQPRIWWVIKT
jgi:Methyltransferase domain